MPYDWIMFQKSVKSVGSVWMIPQYFSVGKISLNGGKRGETGDLSKRSSVIVSGFEN